MFSEQFIPVCDGLLSWTFFSTELNMLLINGCKFSTIVLPTAVPTTTIPSTKETTVGKYH